MDHSNSTDWDAVIVGAGPAGAATAITLARSGARVLMLEKRVNLGASLGESLPPAAIGMVENLLGPIDELFTQAHSKGLTKTSGNVSCWETNSPQTSDFFFTAKGFGLCVERRRFDEALRQSALAAGAKLEHGARITSCKRECENVDEGFGANAIASPRDTVWKIQVSDGTSIGSAQNQRTYTSKFLIDSTGRRAAVASLLGVERTYDDSLFAYAQRFICPAGQDDDLYTRIEASKDGWWYSNRLPNASMAGNGQNYTQRLLVFHTDKGSDAAKKAASTDGLMDLLSRQTTHLAHYFKQHHYQPLGRVRGAAAGSERLREFSGAGWLAVGDAAQAYDPLSSQGILKALRSGSMAGQMVQYSLNSQHSNDNKTEFFMKRYAQEQSQLWTRYTEQRNYYYASQRRWTAQDFWRRRQQPNTHSVSNW